MEWAVHRFELVRDSFDVHRGIHVFTVIIEMAARLPEIQSRYMRCKEYLVISLEMLVSPEVLNSLPDESPIGMPQDQA